MDRALYLGIDVGTTSTKALVVDASGKVVALEQQGYPLNHPQPDWAEQDPADYLRALQNCVRGCVRQVETTGLRAQHIRAMALSTQGDTLIPIDADGKPLTPALSWMDTRAQDECEEMARDAEPGFWYSHSGISLGPFSSACKIRWLARRRPELFARIDRLCWVPDFLALELCGRFATDVPSASWQPVFDPSARAYSQQLMDAVGVSREMLADPVESGAAIGRLCARSAAVLGLSDEVVLVAGAFDQAAAARGAGAGPGGAGVLSCGTAWVLYAAASHPALDPLERIPLCCSAHPSQWGMVAAFTGGVAFDWLAGVLQADAGDASGTAPVESAPVFVPHLYGGLSPDWRSYSRGSIAGLTLSHTGEDIRLALMRGLACETRRNVEVITELAGPLAAISMVGGAARSSTWPQIISDTLQKPLRVSDFTESAAYGAAALAAGEASSGWAMSDIRVIEPGPQVDDYYRRYLEFYEALCPVYERHA